MIMAINSIRGSKSIKGKTVLLRVDYNVPIAHVKKGKPVITDDYKMVSSLKTIRYLSRYSCPIILVSHLGDPQKEMGAKDRFSLAPIALRLERLLGRRVIFVPDCQGKAAREAVSGMKGGDVALLENLRYYAGEEENDKAFAKELSLVAKSVSRPRSLLKKITGSHEAVYVNDAFSVCHRNHASVSAIKDFLPSFAGLLLESEVESLEKALRPKKPAVAVMGGAKISTKIRIIKHLEKSYDTILIGGAMANNFFKVRGFEIGKSLVSEEDVSLAKSLKSKKLILPVDVITNSRMDGKGTTKVRRLKDIKKRDVILDIGPETIKLFAGYIKSAESVIWNGPMGKFEDPKFRQGTMSVARLVGTVSTGKAFGVAGGGETVEAIRMSKMMDYVDWVSTAGGAMLSYLGGEKMPGLAGIIK